MPQLTFSLNWAASLWVHKVNGVFRKELRCDGAMPDCILGVTKLLPALLKAEDSEMSNPETYSISRSFRIEYVFDVMLLLWFVGSFAMPMDMTGRREMMDFRCCSEVDIEDSVK